MRNFEFYNPVKIVFGKSQLHKLETLLAPYTKIMLLYGQGSVKKNGYYDKVISALSSKDFIEFSGIEPNPRYETLMQAVALAKKENVDFLLALGGGSVIDGSKFIAAAVKYTDGDPWNILSKREKITSAIKLGTILSLPATGSEMNGNAVITREDCKEKLDFSSSLLMPVFSFLDPEIMYSLPDVQIANGIIDAFVHITEQYLTYDMNAAVQDAWSCALLKVLIEEGNKVLHNRLDYDANANLMWATSMALNGLLSTGVITDWTTHYIGHELTAVYNIPHAQTLAIVLPGLLTITKEEKKSKLLHYAKNVWNLNLESENAIIDEVIKKTEEFFISLNIKVRLSDYGIGEEVLDIIPSKLEEKNYIKLGENKNISPEIVKKILKLRL